MTAPINLGDRVRIADAPESPILTVTALYLETDVEVLYASCSWKKGAQAVAFPVSELVLVDK